MNSIENWSCFSPAWVGASIYTCEDEESKEVVYVSVLNVCLDEGTPEADDMQFISIETGVVRRSIGQCSVDTFQLIELLFGEEAANPEVNVFDKDGAHEQTLNVRDIVTNIGVY